MTAIRRGFNGHSVDAGYYATGDDLDVDVRWFPAVPAQAPEAHLGGALHSFVVILANDRLANDGSYRQWLEQAVRIVQASDGRHRLMILAENETTVESFTAFQSDIAGAQFKPAYSLGEQAVRPAHYGVIVLNEATRLVLRHLNHGGHRRVKRTHIGAEIGPTW